MNDCVIRTEDVRFNYEGENRPSLDGVSICIRKGVKTVILGANGAGKSTLFYNFNGILYPDKGKVLINDEPVSYHRKGLKKLRSKVSVVLQNPDDQVFEMTVRADVAYGPTNLGLPQDEIDSRVAEALRMVGLTDFADRNPLQLSYGQRKRLAIAGALAMRPEILIMDEPTAGLDAAIASDLMELAEILHVSGTTVVISTHDVDLAYAWADDIHVMRHGKLVYSGDPDVFFGNREDVYSVSLTPPSYFSINRNMSKTRGMGEAPYPKTEPQMMMKFDSGPRGKLTVCPPGSDATGACTGVYGPTARRDSPDADYTSDGFDSCVRRVLTGEDAVLYCDPADLKAVQAKLTELGRFGEMFEVEFVRPENEGNS